MDIKALILKKIKTRGEVKVADIVKITGFSRAYINRFFQELRDEGKIVLLGKANKARYLLAQKRLIRKKKKLKNNLEAIQDLMKGKQTTMPQEHTGEGIFFTSKAGDMLIIQSSNKKLIFNNILRDVFIKDIKNLKGTKISFTIGLKSKRNLNSLFRQYCGDSFKFSKTEVRVVLYKTDSDYVSRSQARRILSGIEKFKTIVLDFRNLDTIGQAFADEVFRVWQNLHPHIDIKWKNANDNVSFMIKRALP